MRCRSDRHWPLANKRRGVSSLSRGRFLRKIGNLDADIWQAGLIGESYLTARMLCFAIREQAGDSWYPETEGGKSGQAYFDRLNIQN
jgi:hypothetical protein